MLFNAPQINTQGKGAIKLMRFKRTIQFGFNQHNLIKATLDNFFNSFWKNLE